MTDRKHIDPTIYTTRPTDERLEKENRVYDLLEELNIPFVRIDHDAMNTIDECQDVDRLLGVEICKNLFLCNSQKTKFYLLMMPGRKKFITRCSRSKFLSKLLKTFDKTFREIFPVFISTKRREKPSAFFDNNFVNNAYFSEAASSSSSHLASSSSKAPISSRMTCLCLWSS